MQEVTGLASLWTSFYRVVTTSHTTARLACWPTSDHSAATISRRCLAPCAAGCYCEAPRPTCVVWRFSVSQSGWPTAPCSSSAGLESASTYSCGSTRPPTAKSRHNDSPKPTDDVSTWRINSTLNCTNTHADCLNGGCRKRWDKHFTIQLGNQS